MPGHGGCSGGAGAGQPLANVFFESEEQGRAPHLQLSQRMVCELGSAYTHALDLQSSPPVQSSESSPAIVYGPIPALRWGTGVSAGYR
jgi:hypothetical protein